MQNNMHNPYIAKIELMNAFCQAQKSDKKSFINELKKIGTKYPETTISNKIDTIVKILTGEDLVADKTTYPKLLGLDESRRRANDLVGEAKAALEPWKINSAPLLALADYITNRDR